MIFYLFLLAPPISEFKKQDQQIIIWVSKTLYNANLLPFLSDIFMNELAQGDW